MTVVGIIPARAGSKRVPGKNLRPLVGQPLVGYACEVARACGVLDAVYINTDSVDIASCAEQHGVACPALRPAHLAADESTTRDANLFILEALAKRGETYDAVMVLPPTAPLRTDEDIRRAWAVFEEHMPCEVVSVAPLVPESWAGHIKVDGSFERGCGSERLYRLNGAIYIHDWTDYVEDRPPRKTVAYVMPPTRSVDIDTQDDLDYAEFLMQRRRASTCA